MTPPLSHRVEALLFAEGGELSKKKLLNILQCTPDELLSALHELRDRLQGGLTLIETDTAAALAVANATADTVRESYENELGKDIGDAGLEVLAVILYCGASSRARIDYIRGVNTSSTIRTLLARGLIERSDNPDDAREYLYKPTPELLAHMGVTDAHDLPEYAKISAELAAFEKVDEPFATT